MNARQNKDSFFLAWKASLDGLAPSHSGSAFSYPLFAFWTMLT